MSGVVFHRISEGVMAQNLKLSVEDARDEHSSFTPDVKTGDAESAGYVLASLGLKNQQPSQQKTSKSIVPNLIGMGARDAVYQLESRGVKAHLRGRGKVKSQSICEGTSVRQGMVCELVLE
jgi:cell division protein FtsI (penicillin-binding protein 3)